MSTLVDISTHQQDSQSYSSFLYTFTVLMLTEFVSKMLTITCTIGHTSTREIDSPITYAWSTSKCIRSNSKIWLSTCILMDLKSLQMSQLKNSRNKSLFQTLLLLTKCLDWPNIWTTSWCSMICLRQPRNVLEHAWLGTTAQSPKKSRLTN